jgi:hypothetical protein
MVLVFHNYMTIDYIYKKLLQQKEQRGGVREEQENKNK